ncbi:UDP-N-acetyl-D-mannosamine dehydrogenase [Alishewanella longhuensis]
MGLAFKADIDDLRESPALDIAEHLINDNVGEILLVEPNIKQLPKRLSQHNDKLTTLPQALERANVLVVLVDHRRFKALHINDVAAKVVIDTRGIFG